MPTRKPTVHRPPAVTHAKVPIEQSTAGKLYRVRDRHIDLEDGNPPLAGTVWGESLSWAEANKLKDQIVGSKQSRTARVEEMTIPMPGGAERAMDDVAEVVEAARHAVAAVADAAGPGDDAILPDTDDQDPDQVHGYAFDLVESDVVHEAPAQGTVTSVPDGHELVVNGFTQSVPSLVNAGDKLVARPVDPQIAASRAKAMAAARGAAQKPASRAVYLDKTVKPPVPRKGPVPKDRTVPKTPTVVRLGAPPVAKPQPPPSPLKVATALDGDPLPEDAITDMDLPDLEVGGGPTDADVQHAERLRDQQRQQGA